MRSVQPETAPVGNGEDLPQAEDGRVAKSAQPSVLGGPEEHVRAILEKEQTSPIAERPHGAGLLREPKVVDDVDRSGCGVQPPLDILKRVLECAAERVVGDPDAALDERFQN